ncbi:MAG: Holliday junction branch migration protein RuvA [candidate division Zixibacteria bacterium]|nr:Holliday junction branch migration protein RuvA [candidate division Zixibacteria bacterium]
MIQKICGVIDSVGEETVTLELHGIFYEILIPSGLSEPLRNQAKENHPVTLYTYYYIEGGANAASLYPRLVGFTIPSDREFFRLFTTVPGIGVRKALRCLTLPVKDIARSIENKDTALLKKLPGIGPRMAEKIIAELSGKATRFALSRSDRPLSIPDKKQIDFEDEIFDVLSQLGYKPAEVDAMMKKVIEVHPDVKTTEEMMEIIFSMENEAAS